MKIVIDVSENETNKKFRRAPLKFATSVHLSVLLGLIMLQKVTYGSRT